jgi:hypothetical protein
VNYYNYSVDLPYTKNKINFREINTQEQLLIAKANISFSDKREFLYDYVQYVLDIILNCIKNKEDFYKINIIEFVLFLVKLRIISVGSTIDFLLKNDGDSKSKTKIQIDLKKYLNNLYNASNYFEQYDNSIIQENNIKIKINWPNIKSIDSFNNVLNDNLEYKIFNETLFEFVEYIEINESKTSWECFKKEEKIIFFEQIPLVIKNKIQEKVLSAFKILVEFDLFEISFFKDYKFSIYNLNFVEHIKMIFSYDLRTLYQEIYFLSYNNLPPNYIMGISNSERNIYMSIIEEQNKKTDKQSQNSPENIDQNNFSDEIKKLSLEFGEDLSK